MRKQKGYQVYHQKEVDVGFEFHLFSHHFRRNLELLKMVNLPIGFKTVAWLPAIF